MPSKKTSASMLLTHFECCSVALFAAFAISAAAGAHAQVSTSSSGRSRVGDTAFARADGDRDGRLSREEARLFPAVSERFDELDLDRDQFLSRAEFEEALKQ
ncbi:MAG: hypothetical protein JWQ88_2937 [Rhodoferax sp.]|nr:hypothetical protein [Rhodoferax sp.]